MGYKLKRILIYPDGVTEKQVYPKTIPQDGLLGYRPLQSDLLDYSGNGKNGSWYSGTGTFSTTGGKTGARVTQSGQFSTQHIVTPVTTTGIEKTLFGWICYNSMRTDAWSGLMTDNDNYSSDRDNTVGLRPYDNNNIYVRCHGNDNGLKGCSQIKVGNNPGTNNRQFRCMTLKNDGTLKFYINGSVATSTSATFTSTTYTTSYYRLGCVFRGTNGFDGTDGWIRHCGVYNRVISDSEVLSIYNLTQ